MLLAKSKESKNSNNKNKLSPTSVGLLVKFMTLAPLTLAETPEVGAAPSLSTWGSVAFSLFIVIGVIFFLSFIMRRVSMSQTAGGQIKTVATLAVGTRERIVVIQVGDEQHMVGVTTQAINHLARLDEPLPEGQAAVALQSTFANLLKQNKKEQGTDA